MMKRKLIRVSTIPDSMETFLEGQLRFLSDHFDVIAVSSPGKALKTIAEREKVRTIAIPMERHISILKDFIALIQLIFLFIKERPYIVHSITPKAGLLSMLAAKITRVPVRIHTFTGLVFPTTSGFLQKILILTDKLTCSCCTYINPEGYGVKHDLENFKITKKPLHVIANGNVRGVNLDYYSRTAEVMRKAATIRQKGKITFCFVGRLVRDKGINELVEVFIRLYGEFKNIRLLLVGPFESELDPLLPRVMDVIQKHEAICYVGTQADVRPFLVASDIFVFPSYREGFPNVLLEAGALGLPSIVTDINGSNEIILSERNGEIVPKTDSDALYKKMKDWLEHPNKVKMMAREARPLIAQRFEQKMLWKALLDTYCSLCSL